MPEMSFCTCTISTHLSDTPPQEASEVGLLSTFPLLPTAFDVPFQLSEKLFDWIEVWRVRRQVDENHSCVSAERFYRLRTVYGSIVHNQDGFWRRKSSANRQKLSQEVFEDACIRRSLEDFGEDDAILSVGRQNLVSLSALKVCHLHRRSPTWRPARAPKSYALITSRLVYVYKVV